MRTQLEWVAYFDSWRRYEIAGQLYISPPSEMVTAGDFAALDKSGASFARVELRTVPHHGIFLCFAPSGAWREYMRIHPTMDDGACNTDVVNCDWESDRATPTARSLTETMRSMIRNQ